MMVRLSWVIQGLRTGIVTTDYPKRPDPSAIVGLRTRPLLHPARCAAASGCVECVQACLPAALALEQRRSTAASAKTSASVGGSILWLDLGRCIGCGLCAAVCPASAIEMTTDAELATHTRQALRQAAPGSTANEPTWEGE